MDIPPESLSRAQPPPAVALPATPPAPLPAVPVETLQQALVVALRALAPAGTTPGYLLELEINGERVEARSDRPIEPGSQMTLRVQTSGRVRVDAVRPPLVESLLQDALRVALPRQQPLVDSLRALLQAQTDGGLPRELLPGLQALLTRLPTPARIQQLGGMRDAIANGGTLLEARLARALSPPAPAALAPATTPVAQPVAVLPAAILPTASRPAATSGTPPAGEAGPAQPAPGPSPAPRPDLSGLAPRIAIGAPRRADADRVPAAAPGRATTASVSAGPPDTRIYDAQGRVPSLTVSTASTYATDSASRPRPLQGSPASPLPPAGAAPLPESGSGTLTSSSHQAPGPSSPGLVSPPPLEPAAEQRPVAPAEQAATPTGTDRRSVVQGSTVIPGAPAGTAARDGVPAPSRANPVELAVPASTRDAAQPSVAPRDPVIPPARVEGQPTADQDSARPDGAPPPANRSAGGAPPEGPAVPLRAGDRVVSHAAPSPDPAQRIGAPPAPAPAPGVTASAGMREGSDTREAIVAAAPDTSTRRQDPNAAVQPLAAREGAPVSAAVPGSPPASSPARTASGPAAGNAPSIAPTGTTLAPGDPDPVARADSAQQISTRDLKAGLLVFAASLRRWIDREAPALAPARQGAAPAAAAREPLARDTTSLYTARGLPEAASLVAPMILPAPGPPPTPDPHRDARRADTDAVEQLLRYVEGALARTRVHQFGAVQESRQSADAPTVPTWITEIPLLHARGVDLLQLRIENHGRNRDAEAPPERVWQVLLCIDTAGTGPLHALLRLRGTRLSATLWAERAGTLRVARAALAELDGALRAQGVEVERLECVPGRPAATIGARFERLLDVRT